MTKANSLDSIRDRLKPCCSPSDDMRWTSETHIVRGHVCATNGYSLVAIPVPPGTPDDDPSGHGPSAIAGLLDTYANREQWRDPVSHSRAHLRKWIGDECPCSNCHGDGSVGCTCSCGHTHESICPSCVGGGVRLVPASVDGVVLNARLLGCVLDAMAHSRMVTIRPHVSDGPARIDCGLTWAYVMPMKEKPERYYP